MAAPSVSFDGTRLSSADSNTDGGSWDKWDASQNPAVEPDIVYEGGNSQSNKVGTSAGGIEFFSFTGGTVDLQTTPKVVLVKSIATNNAALNVQGATGMIVYVGSGTTTNRDLYYTHGSDAYPLKGGWVFDLIDVNEGYENTTEGTFDATAWDYLAVTGNFTATSKSENVALDAVDYFDVGTGLTLIGGDGASADATFEDFRVHQEDTSTNRHGIVSSVEGILYALGMLTIGTATETDFTDATGGTMVFSDGRFGVGTVGIIVDIQHNTSVFSCTGWSFVGVGDTTTADSRPQLTVTGAGTSASATFEGCSFRNFTDATFNVDSTVSACTFTLFDTVDAGDGATLAGSSILTPSTAANSSALIWNVNLDPTGNLDDMTFSKGSNAHHAIEFGTSIPTSNITLNNCAFGTDFSATEDGSVGDETFHFLDTTGTITLNLVGCTGNKGYRTEGVVVTIVDDPVTTALTVTDTSDTAISGARVFLETSDGTGPLPFEEAVTITQTAGTATVAHTAHGIPDGTNVVIRGADQNGYNKVAVITVTGVNEYTYSVDSGTVSPSTGTEIASGVIIHDTTSGAGLVSDTRVFSSSQPFKGTIRASSGSPYYQPFTVTGEVSNTTGFTATIALLSDE